MPEKRIYKYKLEVTVEVIVEIPEKFQHIDPAGGQNLWNDDTFLNWESSTIDEKIKRNEFLIKNWEMADVWQIS